MKDPTELVSRTGITNQVFESDYLEGGLDGKGNLTPNSP